MFEDLPEAIPIHIREIKRLVREEGKTLEVVFFGRIYKLMRAAEGGEHTYELVEFKKEHPQIVTVLLDENLEILPVSIRDPNNTIQPENVHYLVEMMLTRYSQNQPE